MAEKIKVVVEALQLPIRTENEATKDYEQKMAKVCAWLDEQGAQEVSFTIFTNGFVEFVYDDEQHEVAAGWWIVFMADTVVLVLTDEQLEAMRS